MGGLHRKFLPGDMCQGHDGRVRKAHRVDVVAIEFVGQVEVTNGERGIQNIGHVGQQVHGVSGGVR